MAETQGQAQRRSAQAPRGRLRETPCTAGSRSSLAALAVAVAVAAGLLRILNPGIDRACLYLNRFFRTFGAGWLLEKRRKSLYPRSLGTAYSPFGRSRFFRLSGPRH